MLRRTAVAGLSLIAIGTLGLSAPADAATQTFTVPSNGKFTVTGHGYGHGHGMSQYGAYGAAKKGLSSSKILSFYYPGTTAGKATGWLKVLLSGHTGSTLVVKAASGLTVRDRGTGKDYRLSVSGAKEWRLAVSGTHTVVDYKTSAWHRYRPGGHATLTGDGVFFASAGRLTLVNGSTTSVYRNRLAALSPSHGSAKRSAVNIVTLDNYVKGVVPAEMPASWPTQAVRAQAVAARTYAAYERAHSTGYYDICDTSACQVYRGVGGEHAASNSAVAATAGQILDYKKSPAFTQFSASDGGWTSAGSMPYLPAKHDPYDTSSIDPYYSWSVGVSAKTIEKAYPKIGTLEKIKVTSRLGGGDWGGRVGNVTLVGAKGSAKVTGETLRSLYALRSTYFTLTK